MSKSNVCETRWLSLLFTNIDFADVGDAAGLQNSATEGSLYVSLHTADPGEAGSQNTNEAGYTSYARVAVARNVGGWTVASGQVTNAAQITFPTATGGSSAIGWWGVGTASSGAGVLLYYGALGTAFQGCFTAAVSNTFTAPGNSLANDERVVFYSVPGTNLPTGITEGVQYFVINLAGDTFEVSATQGGAAIDITVAGDGLVFEGSLVTITNGITPAIGAGSMIITED